MSEGADAGQGSWLRPSGGALFALLFMAGACMFCLWGALEGDRTMERVCAHLRVGASFKDAILASNPEDRRFEVRVWTEPELPEPLQLEFKVNGEAATWRGERVPLSAALAVVEDEIAGVSSATVCVTLQWALGHDRYPSQSLQLAPDGAITKVGGY